MTFWEASHSDRPAVRSEEDTEAGVADGGRCLCGSVEVLAGDVVQQDS